MNKTRTTNENTTAPIIMHRHGHGLTLMVLPEPPDTMVPLFAGDAAPECEFPSRMSPQCLPTPERAEWET